MEISGSRTKRRLSSAAYRLLRLAGLGGRRRQFGIARGPQAAGSRLSAAQEECVLIGMHPSSSTCSASPARRAVIS
jgi:hypothetical protein